MEGESPAKALCEEATCPLCLDFFKDPVTIDCGHNFCRSCLAKCWGEPGPEASCPQCRESIPQRTFRPNRQLANMAELVQKLQEGGRKTEGRREACKLHQEPLKLFCREDEAPICMVCDRSKEHRGHNVIPLEEAFQEYKEKTKLHLESLRKKREEFKEQHYVQELRRKDSQDIRSSLIRCEKNLGGYVPDVSSDLNERLKIASQEISALQKATESYKESLEEALTKAVWEQSVNRDSCIQAPKKVNVTLDPETACSRLILSQDLKNVRMLYSLCWDVNNFCQESFVLGCERFTAGRHYWEVEVSSDRWAVGISRDSVRKMESIEPDPDDSYWVVGNKPYAKNKIEVLIFPKEETFYLKEYISKICVVLDYEEGRVEFFDANTKEFIYAFSSISFSGEEIRPIFFIPSTGFLKC